jgi:hypothetical protein
MTMANENGDLQLQERNKRDRSLSISSFNTSEKSEPEMKKAKMGDGHNGDGKLESSLFISFWMIIGVLSSVES